VDTLDEVDADDDVDAELDVDALERKFLICFHTKFWTYLRFTDFQVTQLVKEQ